MLTTIEAGMLGRGLLRIYDVFTAEDKCRRAEFL